MLSNNKLQIAGLVLVVSGLLLNAKFNYSDKELLGMSNKNQAKTAFGLGIVGVALLIGTTIKSLKK